MMINEFPDEAVRKMGELGIMGLPYPKEYGGAGEDVISYAIAVEELSRVDGGTGVILSAHVSLGSYPIFAFGTEAQKQKYLVPLARGEKIGAFGLTEPNAGSDAGGTETTAALKGDHYDKLGIRSSSTAELIFNDVKVPKENLLGKEGMGFKIAMATLDGGRIGIASQALGIAQDSYECALDYAKERVQFGKPIVFQQALSFKLADMATSLRASRFLIYSAAELKEHHEPYGMESAMAKQYASDRCLEIVNDALQIFGGSGYLKGMEVERFYRDAKITTIYEGTNEIQRVVIAAHLVGKPPRSEAPAARSKSAATGNRRNILFREGTPEEQVKALVEALKKDGYDFTVGIPIDTPIAEAERVVSAGVGIGGPENMQLI